MIVMAICGFQAGQFYIFNTESIEKIQAHFDGIPLLRIMNDVEGMGQSVIFHRDLQAQHKDLFIQLKHPNTLDIAKPEAEVKMLFTIGTGCGMSLILPYPITSPDGSCVTYKQFVQPSETWTSFQSIDESNTRQANLGKYMFRKMKTKSSLLKFCKGGAILNLHQFMKEQHPDLEQNIEKVVKKQLKAESKQNKQKVVISQQQCITYAAVNDLDKLCTLTVDFLIEIIACSLAKLALTTLPMGGIYIGGGVANYLSCYIEQKQDIFWKYFLTPGPMKESVLEKIPIYLIKENPTLDGLQAMILSQRNFGE